MTKKKDDADKADALADAAVNAVALAGSGDDGDGQDALDGGLGQMPGEHPPEDEVESVEGESVEGEVESGTALFYLKKGR